MLRLSFSARLGMILVIGLLAVWLSLIALLYWGNNLGGRLALPTPERVAAIAELIDHGASEDRQQLLQAVRSSSMNAWIEAESFVPPPGGTDPSDNPRIDDPRLQSFREALGGRDLAIVSPPASARERWFPRLFARAWNATEFRIPLRAGGTLVLETKSPFVVAWFGLPVGFGAGFIGTLIALGALIVLNREIRLIARLAEAVDRVDLGGAVAPLPAVRPRAPETQALVAAFTRLQARLSTMIWARMALVGGIQHDLRTFAARLRLRVSQISDPAERNQADADIADMIALLDDAVLASRAGASELDAELVDVAPIVRAEVADRRAVEAKIDLSVAAAAAEISVLGDRLALRRIVSNLVDNALAYGRAAHLALTVEGRTVILTVDDEGPGISPAQRELLLEPFVRLERSRARRTGGAGLGLAIVRSLVEAHSGEVAIGDAPTGGARLCVRIPVFYPQ